MRKTESIADGKSRLMGNWVLGQPCQLVTYGELGARAAVPTGDLWGTGCYGNRANW